MSRPALGEQYMLAEGIKDVGLEPDFNGDVVYQHPSLARNNQIQTQVVDLPDAETLDDLWDKLGFLPHPQGNGWIEVTGVHRRLNAALKSIISRGTHPKDIVLAEEDEADGSRPFVWESRGGRWGNRHWRVTGAVYVDEEGDVCADEIVVAVESTSRRETEGVIEWTAFVGGPLNSIISDRLRWVIAQNGARFLDGSDEVLEGFESSSLTADEEDAYHDLHTSPVAAWETPNGRIVLWDDEDGTARLHGDEKLQPPTDALRSLANFALACYEPGEIDQSVPKSGRIREPQSIEELRKALSHARYLQWGHGMPFRDDEQAHEAVLSYVSVDLETVGMPEAQRLWGKVRQHPALAARTLSDLYKEGNL